MDVTREDVDRLTAAMQGMTGTLGRVTQGLNSDRAQASARLRDTLGAAAKNSSQRAKAFDSKVFALENNLSNLTGSISQTATHIRRMIGGVFGGAIVGLILERGTAMAKTFSEMNEIGQNFGGSMLKMHQAAAAAGMPLSDFAELVKKNGEVMAKMGTNEFAALALNVRKNIVSQGMYGYSLDQLNGQIGEYAKTSLMYGTKSISSTQASTKSLIDLAENTSVLSAVTKKSREEISALANEAMRGALAIGGMLKMDASMRESTHKTLSSVTSVFAAQQGEAGKLLSKFAADTFGSGFSAITEGGKMLYEKGMGDLASDMDILADKIRAGTASQEDAFQYNNKFMNSVDQNAQMLTMLASTGDAAAAQLLEARSHMIEYSAKDIERARKEVKQREGITKLFSTFEHRMAMIISSLQTGFYQGIEPLLNSFGKMFDRDDMFVGIEKKFEHFGFWFGNLLSTTFNQTNVTKISNMIGDILEFGKTIVGLTASFATYISTMAPLAPILASVVKGAVFVATALGNVAGGIAGFAGASDKTQSAIRGIGAALTLYFGPKVIRMAGRFIAGTLMSKKMDRNIVANIVNINARNVNGGGGGGGGGGPDLGGGSGGGGGSGEAHGPHRGSWRDRARRRFGRGGRGRLWGSVKGHMSGKAGLAMAGSALAMGMMGMAGVASAETMDEDDENKAQSKATAIPLRVMRANMITDANDRKRYEVLIEKRLANRRNRKNLKTDEEIKKADDELKAVDQQIDPLTMKYGTTVTDPHDYNYMRLHGTLPPGSKSNAPTPRMPAVTTATKPKAAQKEGAGGLFGSGMGWLDAASLGLGAASFIPGVGLVTGALGAGVDLMRGDKIGAGLSLASMIPGAGELGAAGKMAHMAGLVGKTANITQNARDGLSVAGGFGAALMPSLFGDDEDSSSSKPVEDFTSVPTETDETKALKALIEQSSQQNQVLAALMAQMAKNQEEQNRLMTKLVNTRP
jgi:hypothetical protein